MATNKDTLKLHEVIAIRKDVKSRVYSKLTELHKANQKAPLFSGMTREYTPLDDDGETYPSESKRVQKFAQQSIESVKEIKPPHWDLELTQDTGNQHAKADIEVDGQVILADVPVTTLLFLEKEVKDLVEFIRALPTLDEDKEWEKDPNSNMYRSTITRTHKSKKVQKPIVLYDATDKHPAQTQLITEDETVGHWSTRYLSGALPVPEKEKYLRRARELHAAVKQARARANLYEVKKQKGSLNLLKFVFD